MGKIALLADLHGNMTAVRAMEKELREIAPEEIIFLGDAVGKGPESPQACDWARENCSRWVGGNWDYGMAADGPDYSDNEFFRRQLGEERLRWLRELPKELELTVSGIRFRLFHGRPAAPLVQGYDSDEVMAPLFSANGKVYGGVIFGDSHRPFVRSTDVGYAVNTGSVGNSIGVPKAHALLLEGVRDGTEPAPLRMTILSVPYDNSAAAEIARNTPGLPKSEAYIREVLTGVYSR